MISGETHDDVTVLKLEHGKVNALDTQLARGLVAALDELLREGTRAVVLTGRGRVFSAGVDLFRIVEGGRDYVEEFIPALSALVSTLVEFPRPLVAAVNGHAIAGGCVMACACDRTLGAVGDGRMGVPELKVGVPFPTLALEAVKAAVGLRTAKELIYQGRTLAMDQAEQVGLVDRLVNPDDLVAASLEEARELAALPADAFALTRRQLWSGPLETQRLHGAARDGEVLELWGREETRERIRRYLEETVGRKG